MTGSRQNLLALRKEEVVLGEIHGDLLKEILSGAEFEVEKSQRQEFCDVIGVVEDTLL